MAGLLVLFLGIYYLVGARAELLSFMRASVWVRASVIVVLGALVAAGLAPPPLMVFGIVDLAAAVWTALAQRAVLETTAVPRARQAVEASAAAYASGELDLLGLLDAQRLALRIARDLERARAEEALAAIELDRATGLGFGGR